MKMDGYPMLDVCVVCGGSVDEENQVFGTCTCDDDDEWELEQDL
jgi:hypothetical protein